MESYEEFRNIQLSPQKNNGKVGSELADIWNLRVQASSSELAVAILLTFDEEISHIATSSVSKVMPDFEFKNPYKHVKTCKDVTNF